MKSHQISDMIGIPRSTTYRILRTLLERGYLFQDLDGRFAVRHSRDSKILPITRSTATGSLSQAINEESMLSDEQIAEVLRAVVERLRPAGTNHKDGKNELLPECRRSNKK